MVEMEDPSEDLLGSQGIDSGSSSTERKKGNKGGGGSNGGSDGPGAQRKPKLEEALEDRGQGDTSSFQLRKDDPLAAQVWWLYTKAKDTLPDGRRLENLTWRMMGMTLLQKKDFMDLFNHRSNISNNKNHEDSSESGGNSSDSSTGSSTSVGDGRRRLANSSNKGLRNNIRRRPVGAQEEARSFARFVDHHFCLNCVQKFYSPTHHKKTHTALLFFHASWKGRGG